MEASKCLLHRRVLHASIKLVANEFVASFSNAESQTLFSEPGFVLASVDMYQSIYIPHVLGRHMSIKENVNTLADTELWKVSFCTHEKMKQGQFEQDLSFEMGDIESTTTEVVELGKGVGHVGK